VSDRQPQGDPESERERVNRELLELLNELRVALPAVQVLFAFLLIVPFSQGFARVTSLQRHLYFASFLCATAASILYIAPSAYHRLTFRRTNKERFLLTSNRMAIAGTIFLALAIAGAVVLVTDVLYPAIVVGVVAAVVAASFFWFWFGLPLTRRIRESAR